MNIDEPFLGIASKTHHFSRKCLNNEPKCYNVLHLQREKATLLW